MAYEAEGAGELPPSDAPLIAVKGLAAQLSAVAGRFYGEPSRGLDLIGVTGTNGKTSVSQLVAQALDLLGERCGIVGTLGTGFYGALESGRHTTPDPLAVQATLATLKQAGARAVAMEVSSHGLDQGRVAALGFDIAVFTNLSRDHLDYHGSMEAYAAAKAKLFAWPGLRCRVINLDDDFGRRLAGEEQDSELITYSLTDSSAFLYCREARFGDAGIEAALVTPHGEGLLRSPLLGRFNLSNLLAAVGALLGLGYPWAISSAPCRNCRGRSAACSAWEAATSRWWWWTTRILPTPWKSPGGPASARGRAPAVPVRLRWRSRCRQASADGCDRRTPGGWGAGHRRQPAHRGQCGDHRRYPQRLRCR